MEPNGRRGELQGLEIDDSQAVDQREPSKAPAFEGFYVTRDTWSHLHSC